MFILPVQFIEIEVAFGLKHLTKLVMTRALKFFLKPSLFATANAKDEALWLSLLLVLDIVIMNGLNTKVLMFSIQIALNQSFLLVG